MLAWCIAVPNVHSGEMMALITPSFQRLHIFAFLFKVSLTPFGHRSPCDICRCTPFNGRGMPHGDEPSCDSALGACSRWASRPPDKGPQLSRAPAQGQEPHRLPVSSPRLAVPVLARPSQWDLSPWTGRAPGPGA